MIPANDTPDRPCDTCQGTGLTDSGYPPDHLTVYEICDDCLTEQRRAS